MVQWSSSIVATVGECLYREVALYQGLICAKGTQQSALYRGVSFVRDSTIFLSSPTASEGDMWRGEGGSVGIVFTWSIS